MTVVELYKKAVRLIRSAQIPDPEIEASFLLGHLLQKSRAELTLASMETVPEEKILLFNQYLSRRLDRVPLAYVLGEQEFWSLPFVVTPDVLIPRPETEQLLDIVFQTLKQQDQKPVNVLDLGTGSGVIASILAMELPSAKVFAVDQSFAALKITKKNIAKHHLEERVFPLCSIWGMAVKYGCWDLVVSNPPYVANNAMAMLEPEVKMEPESALDGGKKGMEEIERIACQLNSLLKPGGWFFIEIGFDQEIAVLDLFNSFACFTDVTVCRDYADLPRVVQGRKVSVT